MDANVHYCTCIWDKSKWYRQHILLILCRLSCPWLLNYEVLRYVIRITRRNMTSCFLPESRKRQSVSQSQSQRCSRFELRQTGTAVVSSTWQKAASHSVLQLLLYFLIYLSFSLFLLLLFLMFHPFLPFSFHSFPIFLFFPLQTAVFLHNMTFRQQ